MEPESPFLENGMQWALDSTSLGWFKRCPRLYQYQMQGWTTHQDNVHLRFGIEYHQALHDYEVCMTTGITHDEAVFDVVRELIVRTADWDPNPREDKRSEMLKTKPNLIRTVIWYLDKYRNDPAKTITLEDGQPAMELSFRFELDYGPPYVLCGHLDRIVEFAGETYVMDRKTSTRALTQYYFQQYEPDNQMTLYSLASKVVLDAPVRGVIVDAAHIQENISEFERWPTQRSPDQLDEWLTDLRYWIGQMEYCAETGYYPQNDTACDKYGGCRFRGVCSKTPGVRENFLKADLRKGEPWNPLKSR